MSGILVSLATFMSNIPVIFVTFRSHRFEEDSAAKVITSLAASDIVNGVLISCCAGVAWSLQPGAEVPMWLLRLLETGLYIFGVCSVSHLAAVSVVKCTVIVRPLTHFTIFTDRVVRAVICTIWIVSTAAGCATNADITDVHFDWSRMTSSPERRDTSTAIFASFTAIIIIIATLIIMISYIKVFLVVHYMLS